MNTEVFDGFWVTNMPALLRDTLTDTDSFYLSILQTIYTSVLSLVLHYQVIGLNLSIFLSFFFFLIVFITVEASSVITGLKHQRHINK